jgi:hypothetical protein
MSYGSFSLVTASTGSVSTGPVSTLTPTIKCFNSRTDSRDQAVDRVIELWQKRDRSDLTLRYEIGAVLNSWFGHPSQPQPYGEGVIERLTQETGLHKSDISRMRWFATLGPSVEAIQDQYPDLTTWTKVKEFLAERNPHKAVARMATQAKHEADGNAKAIKTIERAAKDLDGIDPESVHDRVAFQAAADKLFDVLQTKFDITSQYSEV